MRRWLGKPRWKARPQPQDYGCSSPLSAAPRSRYSAKWLGLEVYLPNAFFYYDGKQILGLSIEDIESFFVAEGVYFEVEKGKTGINVNQNSVRLYAPDMNDLGGRATVESIYVGFK